MRKSLYINPRPGRSAREGATSGPILGGMSRKPDGEVKVAAA
jgi:hypothetical protein